MNNILESRDSYATEKELIEQNNKLKEELMKYRKAEQMTKSQYQKGAKRQVENRKKGALESDDLKTLMNNLGITKNNILKDLKDADSFGKGILSNRLDKKKYSTKHD